MTVHALLTPDAAALARLAAVSAYFVALAALAAQGLHRLWLTTIVLRRAPAPAPVPALGDDLPVVTVQCPVRNEPDVAARLLDAACALDYPSDRLEVQVLDDSDDETTAALRARARRHRAAGIDVHVVRRREPEGFKAGALAHGLRSARGELVAVFDADFVPAPDFLRRVVPSFRDPGVGLVQAAWGHLNRESSWLTRVQALMLDGHFHVEHAARHLAGRFFNFNGTAGVFRRRCIERAGGWRHDTLTEDLDLSYRAQLAGWRFAFRADVVAPAELPRHVDAWKGQQRRWTTGAVQTARKLLPGLLAAPLPWRIKLEAFAHLTSNAAHPLLLLLGLTLLPSAWARRSWGWDSLAAVELPLLAATTGVLGIFYGVAARRAGRPATGWTLLQLLALGVGSSLANSRAVVAGLLGDGGPFVRTPKTGDEGPARPRRRGRHAAAADPWAIVETLLGLIFAGQVVAAAARGLWPTVPFLTLFAAGFLAVGLSSLAEGRSRAGVAVRSLTSARAAP